MDKKNNVRYRTFLIGLLTVVVSAGIARAASITAAEYYIDTDPGQGNGTTLSAKDGTFNSAVEDVEISLTTSSLTIGVHNLFVRMRNDSGIWGTPRKVMFNVDGNQYVAAQEYYVDTDPGEGNGTPLTAVDGVFNQKREQGTAVLNTSSLTAGLHTLYIRAKNAEGHWGTPRIYTIEIINQPTLMAMEYYIDSDPGAGLGSAMTSLNGSFGSFKDSAAGSLNTTSLGYGDHTVYVRAKSSFLTWGAARSVLINVAIPPIPDAPTLALPSNSATNQLLNLSLSWSAVAGASTYRVQLSTSASFADTVADDSTLTLLSKAAGPLSTSKTYYWRVNAKNVGGTSAWSEVWSFGTIPPATGAPTLALPSNSATNQPLSLSLTWNTVSGATTYRVQLSTSAAFSDTVVDDSTLTVLTKAVSALSTSKTYYWRVNAKNAGGTSAWSDVWNFTTVPPASGAPTLASPSNSATNQPLNLSLTWNTVSGATTYRVQLSTSAAFTDTVVDDSTLTVLTKAVSALSTNKTYYWRVNAKNVGGTSAWSEVWSFGTIPPATGAPTLASPSNRTTNQPLSLSLNWNAVTGAATYRVQLSTSASFTDTVIDDSILTVLTKTIGPISAGKTYYWRVNAKNAGGTSAWSDVWSFGTIPPVPDVPNLVFPSDNASDVSIISVAMWNRVNGAVSYRLQIAADSLFASITKQDSTIIDSSTSCGTLANDTKYFWRVNASNAGGSGVWSSVRRFTTIVTIPSVVILKSPARGDTVKADSVHLTWSTGTPKVDRYWEEYASDSSFTAPTIDSTVTDTIKLIRNLQNNSNTWWRIRAHNAAGWGIFSDARKVFVNIPSTAVLPKTYSFNFKGISASNSFIRYSLPKACNVSFRLYNIQGKLIRTFINANQSAGNYQTPLQIADLSRGCYLMDFKAGSFSVKKKISTF